MYIQFSADGKDADEWSKLSDWAANMNVFTDDSVSPPRPFAHVTYLVQVPRLFPLNFAKGCVTNFGEFLHKIFAPLFESTLTSDGSDNLARLLRNVVGFDSVDDESQLDHLVPEKITVDRCASEDGFLLLA